jgi:hypothetical protein
MNMNISNISRTPVRRDEITGRRYEELDPLLTLHREMNRLFSEVFYGSFQEFDAKPFGFDRAGRRRFSYRRNASSWEPPERANSPART